eukprot:gnl/MRDRNA2_/MRDRNA2_143688_c0_seq1.p1 gnl/MRDRNA2_/MRDRNA2_143688_c0~~gnl/MRDRNA2_/MRDRNA2_143688_c0_seq1.p1  ORF type:complete len:285 (+),score=38.91 gnl/MRDRNA2_/MRDRNA2_143688_c0_seq1:78-932(+)
MGCSVGKNEQRDLNLFEAAHQGNVKALQRLISAGTDLNVKSGKNGWTAATWAVVGDHESFLQALAEHGAELDLKDACGRTPIMFAAEKDTAVCLKVLLEWGADHNVADQRGQTALMLAVQNRSDACARLLAEHGNHLDTGNDKAPETELPLSVAPAGCNIDILTCSVCLSNISSGDVTRTLPCQHRFHLYCIEPWLRKQRFCPVCRGRVDAECSATESGIRRRSQHDRTSAGYANFYQRWSSEHLVGVASRRSASHPSTEWSSMHAIDAYSAGAMDGAIAAACC